MKGQLGIGLHKKIAFTGLQEVKIALPTSNSSADVAKRTFRVGANIKWKGDEGVVINHSRGRLGLELSDGTHVGALPGDVYLNKPTQGSDGEDDERVFVDDIVCGTTFSAALSGGLLYLWGDIMCHGSHVPYVLPADTISGNLVAVVAAFPTIRNSLILVSEIAEELTAADHSNAV